MITIVVDNYAHRVTNAKVLISAPMEDGAYSEGKFQLRSSNEMGLTAYEAESLCSALRNLNYIFPEGRLPLPHAEHRESVITPLKNDPTQPMAVA